MKKLLTLLLSLFTFAAMAQVPQAAMLWLKGVGGNGTDVVGSFVTKTTDGGFIIGIGSNSAAGTGNIDSFCDIGGGRSIFLKYNSDASILEWSKCYSTEGDTSFGYMFPTAGGGNVFGGEFDASVNEGFYICKQSESGTILWSKSYSKGNGATVKSMIPTSDGGYIMVGETLYADTNFTIHHGSFINADIGVLKLDSLGNKVWCTVLGGTGDERCRGVAQGPNNSCYVIGNTPSDDFDCSGNHGSSGSTDMYVARLDNNGNILWHRDLGGTDNEDGNWGCPDGNGGVIVAGSSGSNDGDVTHQINPTGDNIWVVDLDSNNNIVWNNCYGGGGQEFSTSVCKATDGTIWIAGQSQIKGGEVDTSYGSTDAWMVHADNIGNFISAIVLGSSEQDEGYMIYPLSNGSVIAGGYYSKRDGAFDSIESYSSFPATDAFLTAFGPWPEGVQQIPMNNAVKIYPNPADEIVNIEALQNNNYTVIVTDVIGRSVYTTNLNGKVQIRVTDWQTGIYYVQIVSENGYMNAQKLIVQ